MTKTISSARGIFFIGVLFVGITLLANTLLRNFKIDNLRQQLIVSEKNREISDYGVEQTIATTTRAVRNAYYDLAYATASLAVQQQSH